MSAEIERQEKFREVFKHFDNAMLVTMTSDHQLRARPMAIAEIADDDSIWFITGDDSAKVDEIESDWHVALTMQDSNRFLSVSGSATIQEDREKIRKLWREPWKVWFPKGPDDPHVSLIHFRPSFGEYWDNSGAEGWKYLYKAGKAYFTGTRPSLDQDIHAKVRL